MNAEALVRQEIERRGSLDFSSFVDLALYHPRYGYYNQPAPRRGRGGDYFTSLQVSPLFPDVFAEAILQLKDTLGSDQFSLIEVGAGGGEFLEGVLTAINRKMAEKHLKAGGLRVWAVERSAPARDALHKRLSRFPRCQVVASMDDIEWMGTLDGCIFSNEFFDALAFHRFRWRAGGWREVHVGLDQEKFVEVETVPTTPIASRLADGGALTDGHEIEFRPQIGGIYEEWSARLSRGYVLTVDYGHPRESFLSPARARGTWMCYRRHAANKTPFEHLGEQDITAHVDFSQLVDAGTRSGFDPSLFCSQGIFLSHMGQVWIEKYLLDADETQKRQRAGAVQQLLHPDAMGEAFWVLLQSKGADVPPAFSALPNRLRRLI